MKLFAGAAEPPKGLVVLAAPLVKVELVLDPAGEPTGDVLVSAWARDGVREWLQFAPPPARVRRKRAA